MEDTQSDYSLATAEKVAIKRALRAVGWNKRKAARMLGIGKTTLYRKVYTYDLEPEKCQVKGDS